MRLQAHHGPACSQLATPPKSRRECREIRSCWQRLQIPTPPGGPSTTEARDSCDIVPCSGAAKLQCRLCLPFDLHPPQADAWRLEVRRRPTAAAAAPARAPLPPVDRRRRQYPPVLSHPVLGLGSVPRGRPPPRRGTNEPALRLEIYPPLELWFLDLEIIGALDHELLIKKQRKYMAHSMAQAILLISSSVSNEVDKVCAGGNTVLSHPFLSCVLSLLSTVLSCFSFLFALPVLTGWCRCANGSCRLR